MSAGNDEVSTDEVWAHAYSGRQTPYQWLARAVSSRATLICDLACGSGRMVRELELPGRTVIGLDADYEQLRAAANSSEGLFVAADARSLPFADGSLDAVTTAQGLPLFSPLSEVFTEVARVLRPGGVFAAIAPTVRPVRMADLSLGSRLSSELRSAPPLPATLEILVGRLLIAAGLTRAEDRRERYGYRVNDEADARRLIAGLYGTPDDDDRLGRAVDLLLNGADDGPVTLAIPIRRIVAVK